MPDRVEVSTSTVRTDDWPAQATDSIVKVVGTVQEKVTGPVTTVARGIVFGTFAAILGGVAFALLIILAIRVVNNYLPDAVFGENHVWAAYFIVGVLLCLIAFLLWLKREPKQAEV
jgi:MFS family permease